MQYPCTLFLNDELWRLACAAEGGVQVHDFESVDDLLVDELAERVTALIAEQGIEGVVLLALPSSWCLSATIDASDLGRTNRRQAMRYLLEEQLPISAEESVSDFVEHHGLALGVAAQAERVQPIVEALQLRGVIVRGICPAAMVVGAGLVTYDQEASALIIRQHNGYDLMELQRHKPSRWWWLPDESTLREQLVRWQASLEDDDGRVVTLGVDAAFDALDVVRADRDAGSIEQVATEYAAGVLCGEVMPWIDLQRDALQAHGRHRAYRKQAGVFAAAAVFLLLCVIGGTYWRGEQYRAYAEEVDRELIEQYKQALPGQRVPAARMILRRLESEQRQLAGVGGQGDAGGIDELRSTSALTQLHTVLTAWPKALRYRISDMTIEPNLIRVNGQAADAVIPDKLAQALRSTGVYEVDPANTRALSGFGFSFGFLARPVPDAEVTEEAKP